MKWTAVVGWASQTAQKGKNFYNHQNRRWYNAIDQKESDQSSFLGKELDYTLTYKMGSDLTFSWDLGAWMPGAYYEFTNHPYQKSFTPSIMWASQLRVGLTF